MKTYNEIVQSVRSVSEDVADKLEMSIKTEQAKADKSDRLAVGMMLERLFRTQIDGALKGKPIVLPGRFLHLDVVVHEAVDVLKASRPVPERKERKAREVVPNTAASQDSPERGSGRMKNLEDVLLALDVAVLQDGYSLLISQDRGKCIVTAMSSKQERMLAVTAEDVKSTLADMVGKLMRVS